jgi:alpha-glucuronidase
MQLQGYEQMDVVPWEAASGGQGVQCPASSQSCDASLRFTGQPGKYDLDVEYFDQNNGASKFRVYVGDRLLDEWFADAHLPSNKPDGDSSTRRHIAAVTLDSGDEVRIEGIPEGGERAPIDYVAIHPTQ